jgi:hypothetical protein
MLTAMFPFLFAKFLDIVLEKLFALAVIDHFETDIAL